MLCSICTEEITNASWLPCCHAFCKDCIDTWTNYHPSCPICRYDLRGTADFCIDVDIEDYGEMPALIDESDDEEPPPLEVVEVDNDDNDEDSDWVPFN